MITQIDFERCPWELVLLADPSRSVVEGYLSNSVVLLCFDGDEILGVVVVTPLSHSSWEIKNLAVSPCHQGKGIGRALIRAALVFCRGQGCSEMWIGTGNSSLGQLALYQKMGFRMVEILRDFFVQNYADEIVENGIRSRDMVRLVARGAEILPEGG
jgi:ribosomal protein S18 acetylase RimI-like enzyme